MNPQAASEVELLVLGAGRRARSGLLLLAAAVKAVIGAGRAVRVAGDAGDKAAVLRDGLIAAADAAADAGVAHLRVDHAVSGQCTAPSP